VIGLIGLLRHKWTYLIAGGILAVVGVVTYISAHPAAPVQVSGSISDYTEYTRNGSYDRNELKIAGSDTTYTLDKTTFHPSLPDEVFKDGKVDLWVDSGSTTIIAIQLYDENDTNPTKYTTDHFDNPSSERSDGQSAGIALGVIGVILVGVFALWFFLGGRRPSAMQMAGGTAMPVPMPMPMPVPVAGAPATAGTSTGLSPDGKWYWDGGMWRNVSADGRYWWDGAKWQQVGAVATAAGAPPPVG
jgi:hypothetical protein